jgi:hypothetical protein
LFLWGERFLAPNYFSTMASMETATETVPDKYARQSSSS